MRPHLSYADVASTLALVVALSGTGAYAAGLAKNSVTSKQIKNHAIKAVDLKKNSVTGAAVRESTLAKVPLAAAVDGFQRITATTPMETNPVIGSRGALQFILNCASGPTEAVLRVASTANDSSVSTPTVEDDDIDASQQLEVAHAYDDGSGDRLKPVEFTARTASGTSITVVGSVEARVFTCKADLHVLG